MRHVILILAAMAALAVLPRQVVADSFLGTAEDYAILAGTTVTNTGSSVINGNIGVSPGGSFTGGPPLLVLASGTVNLANAASLQAQTDLTAAYLALTGLPVTAVLTGTDLGGLTLTPGVYFFSSSAQLTGTLTLNFQGNPDALFVFLIGSTLTTATSSSVTAINLGGLSLGDAGCNVFWQVGSSATLGTTTAFMGHILALTSITLNTGATIVGGSALARNGAVTLDANIIDNFCFDVASPGGTGGTGGGTTPTPGAGDTTAFLNQLAPVPEPTTISLVLLGGALLGLGALRTKLRARRAREAVVR